MANKASRRLNLCDVRPLPFPRGTVAVFYIRNVRQTTHTMDMFRAIDGCALSVDSAAPLNDRSLAQSSIDRAPGSVGGLDWIEPCFTSRQHSTCIGYMGDGFYRSKDPTSSTKVLGTYSTQKNQTYNYQTINTKHSKSPNLH